jgi:F-type H+-transporting ATPase subunit gamma
VQIGDRPQLDKLSARSRCVLDAYAAGKLKAVLPRYTRFINTMRQEPVIEQLLPLTDAQMSMEDGKHGWDYIYEPEAKVVIDELLVRYVEALVYHAHRRERGLRAGGAHGGDEVGDRQRRQRDRRAAPVYNKTRQAAITKELSEIVAGAAAV